MAQNLIRGYQIAGGAVALSNLGADVLARFSAIEGNITSIESVMSTDQERIDAINGVMGAFQAADSNLQGAITALGSGINAGAGLGEGGAYQKDANANYINTATSLHNATQILDSQLKLTNDAVAAETAARESAVTGLQGQIDAITGGAATKTNIYGANATVEVATFATPEDRAAGVISVSHDVLVGAPFVVFLNGQKVGTADAALVNGQTKKIAIANYAADAFADGNVFEVQYFFR